MARQIKVFETADGRRYRVRYRKAGVETSQTFRRQSDAEMFRDILGNGRVDRIHEAEAWLAAKEDQQRTATFGEWFPRWADSLTGITPRTRADYRALHRRYLTSLDHLPLPLITRTHVATLVNELEDRGLSAKTVRHAIHMLSTCLAVAVDDGLIARNPVRRVPLPRVRKREGDIFLTPSEASRLIRAIPEHYRPLVTFLFGSGLRWSEATALQVRHVDLDNGTVRVERAWKRVPGKGWEIGPPKTEKGWRTVNAAADALIAVKPLLDGRKSTDLVFTTERGNRVGHNFGSRFWIPACKRAGLVDPRPKIKDCRSTFGSWLVSEGIGIEAVQDQLGHESLELTRKVYAHLMPAVGVEAGRAASAAMRRALAAVDPVEVRALPVGLTGQADDSD